MLFRKKEITKKITKRITELLDARCCRLKKQQRRLEWRRTMPGLTQYGTHNGVALLAIQPDFPLAASCSLLQPLAGVFSRASSGASSSSSSSLPSSTL